MTKQRFTFKTRCMECDAYLWSDWFRSLGVCTECHNEDLGPKDLEERFDEWCRETRDKMVYSTLTN